MGIRDNLPEGVVLGFEGDPVPQEIGLSATASSATTASGSAAGGSSSKRMSGRTTSTAIA